MLLSAGTFFIQFQRTVTVHLRYSKTLCTYTILFSLDRVFFMVVNAKRERTIQVYYKSSNYARFVDTSSYTYVFL